MRVRWLGKGPRQREMNRKGDGFELTTEYLERGGDRMFEEPTSSIPNK